MAKIIFNDQNIVHIADDEKTILQYNSGVITGVLCIYCDEKKGRIACTMFIKIN